MDEVIYSASPFQAFLASFLMIGFFVILGMSGLGMGILRRREKTFARVAMGCAGIFLCVVGVAIAFVSYRSITGDAKTITTHLNDKQIAHDNCGDNSSRTCERYILETQAGAKFYDLNVNKATYEKAEIDACYAVTYYPGKGLFGPSEYRDSYETVSNITRIELVEASACQ